jgi:hypothetical protein
MSRRRAIRSDRARPRFRPAATCRRFVARQSRPGTRNSGRHRWKKRSGGSRRLPSGPKSSGGPIHVRTCRTAVPTRHAVLSAYSGRKCRASAIVRVVAGHPRHQVRARRKLEPTRARQRRTAAYTGAQVWQPAMCRFCPESFPIAYSRTDSTDAGRRHLARWPSVQTDAKWAAALKALTGGSCGHVGVGHTIEINSKLFSLFSP